MYRFVIVIKGTDILGNTHTLVFSEKRYNGDESSFPNSVWIGAVHIMLGTTNISSGLNCIREMKSLFFCFQKPVDLKTLCCYSNNVHVNWVNKSEMLCLAIFRNFKKYLGKQPSPIVTRTDDGEHGGLLRHSIFEHDIQGKIHGIKKEYVCVYGLVVNFIVMDDKLTRRNGKDTNKNLQRLS